MLSKEFILKVTNIAVYLILLCVGLYLVYQGDVVAKFTERTTNFAETLSWQISELPMIVHTSAHFMEI